jgi:hypothetical protein
MADIIRTAWTKSRVAIAAVLATIALALEGHTTIAAAVAGVIAIYTTVIVLGALAERANRRYDDHR